jgi:hypothetical protein
MTGFCIILLSDLWTHKSCWTFATVEFVSHPRVRVVGARLAGKGCSPGLGFVSPGAEVPSGAVLTLGRIWKAQSNSQFNQHRYTILPGQKEQTLKSVMKKNYTTQVTTRQRIVIYRSDILDQLLLPDPSF